MMKCHAPQRNANSSKFLMCYKILLLLPQNPRDTDAGMICEATLIPLSMMGNVRGQCVLWGGNHLQNPVVMTV